MDLDLDWCSPAACTLDPAAQPERVAEWDALFATAVRSVRPVEGGVCVDLAPAPGRSSVVADLADREAQCCDFLVFGLTVTSSTLLLAVTTDTEHAEVVAALGRRARSLVGPAR